MGDRSSQALKVAIALATTAIAMEAAPGTPMSISVPIVMDHGRVLVDGELQAGDRPPRLVRLWIDTGVDRLSVSSKLWEEYGGSLGGSDFALSLGGVALDLSLSGGPARNLPDWIFAATGADMNLPVTVLARYRTAFDFAEGRLVLSDPASPQGPGTAIEASIDPRTRIAAIPFSLVPGIAGKPMYMAIDFGASYSFLDGDAAAALLAANPSWPRFEGSAGAANMWGKWPPLEASWTVFRPDDLYLGPLALPGSGIVALPRASLGGLGAWYSSKTAHRVEGFLGPNAFAGCRVEFDYRASRLIVERRAPPLPETMAAVPIALSPEDDGSYRVLCVAHRGGEPLCDSVLPGDILLSVDGKPVRSSSMGSVSALLAGVAGEKRLLSLLRSGLVLEVEARVVQLF